MVLVVGMTALVVLAFAIPLAVLIRHNVYRDAVTSLQSEADGIAALFLRPNQAPPTTAQIGNYLGQLDPDRSASVQLPNGQVLGQAPPGGVPTAVASTSTGDPFGGPGSDDGTRGGPPRPSTAAFAGGRLAQLRVPDAQGTYVIRVYASDGELHSGETGWWLLLAGASVGLLLVAGAAGEILTRRIVRPLTDTAETARALSVGDTAARAPTDGPREIGEVGVALNRLADRIDQLIAEERETVADLSHRLRTPLTALRLDAESLRDPADAERVGTHVSALERMLTAVIHAARRPQREGRMPACDATAVVTGRVAFWSALTDEQERTSSVTVPSTPVIVRAAEEDLAAAVDALVENVVAHTPEGTPFAVRLTATADGARLEVSDEGPGLPTDEPVRGRSDRGSSGLGLDIARRCAEASGGSMTLGASPTGGALVTLDLRSP
jgi:signal transduction histidine kinase